MDIEPSSQDTRHAHGAGDRTGAQTAQPAVKPFRLPFGLTLAEARAILPDIASAAVCAGALAWAWAGPVAAALAVVAAGTLAAVIATIDIRQPWSPGSCQPRPFRPPGAREDKYPSHPRRRK
jgi:hypothetical protein